MLFIYRIRHAPPGTSSLEEANKMTDTGSAREPSLILTGLASGAPFEIEILDREHANATAAWEAMGKPDPATREQASALRAAAWNTKKELVQAGADGTLTLKRSLDAWTLLLVHQL
jgi:xylan 1,4-beta-xylosidase